MAFSRLLEADMQIRPHSGCRLHLQYTCKEKVDGMILLSCMPRKNLSRHTLAKEDQYVQWPQVGLTKKK